MPILYICNTFFEQELEAIPEKPLKNWLCINPVVQQLQTLPLLFAGPEDRVLTTQPGSDLRLSQIDAPPQLEIMSWGASESIAQYAAKHGLFYKHPPLSVVREIHSKAFAFENHPLPGAALLHTPEEVRAWIRCTPGPKVLKRVLGFAGKGHFFVDRGDLDVFLAKEFAQNRPILGEPWLLRTLDFSSQWEIQDTIELVGITRFETSNTGKYLATIAGPMEEHQRFIDQHLEVAWQIVEKIRNMGFFGSMGIDAFVYGDGKLHPIVEINARKTMGRVALEVQKPRGPLRMSFNPKSHLQLSIQIVSM